MQILYNLGKGNGVRKVLLAVDVGNTSISFGLFDSDEKLLAASKMAVYKSKSADEYAVLIKQLLDFNLSYSDYTIDSAAVASVVPSITPTILSAAQKLSGHTPYQIGPGVKTGFKIAINDPASLGADIVSNIAASLKICEPPLVVLDAGTATTITVIDDSRTLIGTVIMSGIRISADALKYNTELLDTISLDSDDVPMIGKNTDQAIRSGLINGNSFVVDGYIRWIRETVVSGASDRKLGLIATGGFAGAVTKNCRNKFLIDDNLTLRGIAALYYKKHGK